MSVTTPPGGGDFGTPEPTGDQPAGQMVYVSLDDGSTPIPVEYVDGMSVRDALDAANVQAGRRQTATINGQVARKSDRIRPGSTIVVTENVAGG